MIKSRNMAPMRAVPQSYDTPTRRGFLYQLYSDREG